MRWPSHEKAMACTSSCSGDEQLQFDLRQIKLTFRKRSHSPDSTGNKGT